MADETGAPVRFLLLVCICAALAGGIGLVALLGWVLGIPVLASLGSDMIPVAPSTAVIFMLCAAVLLLSFRLTNRGVYWTVWAVNMSVALVVLLLFILSIQGIHLPAEHLGIAIVDTQAGPPIGHMSPVTAFCFLLAAISFMSSLASPKRPHMAALALWLSCLLIAIGFLLVLAYLYGVPLLYGSPFIPPAAPTSMAFMALGSALLALAAPQVRQFRQPSELTTRASYNFILIFVLLAAGIITAGYLSFRSYEKRMRAGAEQQLSSIADLKTGELVQWRKERLEDASIFFRNTAFSSLVGSFFQRPEDRKAREQVRTWLNKVQEHYQYDRVYLLDARGELRMSAPKALDQVSAGTVRRALEILRSGHMTFQDFYRSEKSWKIHLALLVPIVEERPANQPLGVLVLRIDPEQYLYPFINRWPTPSQTAETLLIRKEGSDALFLNELRFQKNTALTLRSSLKNEDMTAVQAAMGRRGIVQGIDYRGMPVVADVRPVPGSPWFLVARMDISEVYAQVRERLWIMVGFVVVLLFGAGVGVGFVWRQQRVRFYMERSEAAEELKQKNAELEHKNEDVKTMLQQLWQATKLATVGELAASIAHELNNPLATVSLRVGSLLSQTSAEDPKRHALEVIEQEVVRMGNLVANMLQVSRRNVPQISTVDVREEIEKTFELIYYHLRKRNINIVREFSPDTPLIHADRQQLRQLFLNLFTNAGDAMLRGGTLTIRVNRTETRIGIEISDTGTGISPENLLKVMEPFFTTKLEGKGTGLGLSICRRIIEELKGTIDIQSEVGRGTTVAISLPVKNGSNLEHLEGFHK